MNAEKDEEVSVEINLEKKEDAINVEREDTSKEIVQNQEDHDQEVAATPDQDHLPTQAEAEVEVLLDIERSIEAAEESTEVQVADQEVHLKEIVRRRARAEVIAVNQEVKAQNRLQDLVQEVNLLVRIKEVQVRAEKIRICLLKKKMAKLVQARNLLRRMQKPKNETPKLN